MIAADLKRFKRMAAQGVQLPAATLEAIRAAEEAEDLNAVDDEAAGKPGEVHRAAAEAEHAHDCGCTECAADRAAVDVDCGEHDRGASYRAAVFVTKDGARYRSRRATSAAPGESDDWEAVGPARAAPATRPSTKAKFAPPKWLQLVVEEVRGFVNERIATLERKLETKAGGGSGAELEARVAALEERLRGEARDWARGALIDTFRGTFDDHTRYAAGELTVYSGSLWLCVRDADGARPGKSDCWRVVARAGKDAR